MARSGTSLLQMMVVAGPIPAEAEKKKQASGEKEPCSISRTHSSGLIYYPCNINFVHHII